MSHQLIDFAHVWTIEHFDQLCRQDRLHEWNSSLKSESFSPSSNTKYELCLELNPANQNAPDNVGLYLTLNSSPTPLQTVIQFRFSLLKSNNAKCNTQCIDAKTLLLSTLLTIFPFLFFILHIRLS